jgi:sigma-E factor negative regulatory protein RseB
MRFVRQGPSIVNRPGIATFRASDLPPGFRLTIEGAQTLGMGATPASHLVYSDGLATVSVFVEAQTTVSAPATGGTSAEAPIQGLARVGSGYAYSTVISGHQVTAVGEVPAQTVEFIAHSVKISGAPPPPPR